MKVQIPKGLFDIVPYGTDQKWKLSHLWVSIEEIIRKITTDYGFKEIRTPIFERTELFNKGIGETSDIIKKEIYTFLDKAERSMSLRPEGTASVLRAFIENNLFNEALPHKYFYIGPMFRYDRPQAGRYRQHHQFGVEVLGETNFEQDVEVIDLLWEFYRRLGLKNLTLYLNSIGDPSSRETYKKELKKFLTPYFKDLSLDSQERLEKNPLRILDSKDEQDQKIVKEAPSILDFLNKESKNHFDQVCSLLQELKIPYTINHKLVRGLDYYNHTVFEVVAGKIGAQNSIGGGGRYDGLVKQFGGPDLSAVGFGTGLERVIQTMLEQGIELADNTSAFIYFIPLDEEAKKLSFLLSTQLRHLQVPVEQSLSIKKLPKVLKIANNLKAPYCVILGEEERLSGKILVKDMIKREQKQININEAIDYLSNLWQEYKKTK